MAKTFFLTLALAIVLVVLWTFFWPKTQKPFALQVISSPSAQIFLDGQSSGTTPYQNKNLGKSQTVIKLATVGASWSGQVRLTSGTWTILNRELSDNPLLGAGETLTLEKGKGLYIISIPDQAQIEVDDKKVGQTPLLVTDLSPGDHKIVVSKDKYVTRAIQAKTHKSYKLVLNIQLSLEQEALAKLLAPLSSTPSARLSERKVTVLSTSTGWLRVRDQPSLAGKEIGKVNEGIELPLLQEEKDWVKIRAESGLEGWVSAQFVKKVE